MRWGDLALEVERPTSYFRDNGSCPEVLTLRITPPTPRSVPSGQPGTGRERIERLIAGYVEKAHNDIRREGRTFLGRKGVLAGSFVQRALSHEQRFGIIPTVATKVGTVMDRLRKTERQFRARYRAALGEWRVGVRGVLFPFGTWGMRVLHGAGVDVPARA